MEELYAAAAICHASSSREEAIIHENKQQELQSNNLNESSSESYSYEPLYMARPIISGSLSEDFRDAMPLHRRSRSTPSANSINSYVTGQHAPLTNDLEIPGVELEKWPRVAVTPSMLYAYARMKGKVPDTQNDVLHSALYPGQKRRLFNRRVWLPRFDESISIEELPRGACYYWDPVTEVNFPIEPGIHEEISLGLRAAPSSPQAGSYEEYISRHPLPEGLSKYKGKEGHANFGYLKINKTWVDPDSEGQLHNAYVNTGKDTEAAYQSYADDAAAYNSRYIGEPGLPPFKKPVTINGTMTPEAEDKFYKDFVDFVSDDEDGEGDPRTHRISPKTFARWATGSRFPSQYTEPLVTSEANKDENRNTGTENKSRSRKLKRTTQFDVETGSTMTGEYKVEDNPSLLEDAEGVDPHRPPQNFNMMNPMAARELNRQAYGPAWADYHQRGTNLSPATSNPGTFVSEEGVELLARPGFPETGIREYYESKGLIKGLAWEAHQSAEQNHQIFNQMNNAGNHRSGLQKEIQFLKAHKKEGGQGSRQPFPWEVDTDSGDSEGEFGNLLLSPETLHKSRRRKEYKRHVAEAISNQAISVAKQRVTGVKLKDELDDILLDIMDLTKVKDALLQKSEIETAEQLHDLIAKRIIADEDTRAQFNERLQQQ